MMHNTVNLYLLEELCYGSCLYQDGAGLGYLTRLFPSQDSVRNISFLMQDLAVEHGIIQESYNSVALFSRTKIVSDALSLYSVCEEFFVL